MACDNILVMHPLLKHFDHFQNECVGPVLAATVISSILGTSYSIDGFKLQLNTMIEDSNDAVSTLIAPLSINKAELKPDHSWQPIARRLVDDPSLLILGEPEVVYANNRSLHRRTLLKELYETPADKPTFITIGKDKNEIPNGAISTLIFFSFYGLVRYLSKAKDEFLDRFIMLHESVVAPTKTELTLVEPQELTDWIATAKTLNRTLSQSRASIEIEWLPNARIAFDHLLDKELSTTRDFRKYKALVGALAVLRDMTNPVILREDIDFLAKVIAMDKHTRRGAPPDHNALRTKRQFEVKRFLLNYFDKEFIPTAGHRGRPHLHRFGITTQAHIVEGCRGLSAFERDETFSGVELVRQSINDLVLDGWLEDLGSSHPVTKTAHSRLWSGVYYVRGYKEELEPEWRNLP